ncbi:MAG: AI-2E family transporter [Thermoguttaceae bacterium]
MNQKESKPSLLKNYCVILSSIIVILAGVYSARSVLGPFLLASFFAVLLVMPMNWLTSKGVCQWLALTVISIGVLLVGGGAATIVGSQIAQFASDIPEYRHRFITTLEENNLHIGDAIPFFKEDPEPESEPQKSPAQGSESTRQENAEPKEPVKSEELLNLKEEKTTSGVEQSSWEEPIDQKDAEEIVLGPYLEEALDEGIISLNPLDLSQNPPEPNFGLLPETPRPIIAPEPLPVKNEGIDTSGITDDISSTAVALSSQQLFKFLAGLATELSYIASNALIITLLVIFMLLEAAMIPKKLIAALGERNFVNSRIMGVVHDIRRYMAIKTFMSLAVGFLVVILLYATNVQYPLLWGFVAFLLNYIPNIGSVVAAIPPIVLAVVDHGIVVGAVDTVFFVLINCVVGYGLEPRLLGKGLDLSPLIVLIALIFFGWLLGPVGMFLSPPLAVVTKIICLSFPETRWIAALMAGSVQPLPPLDDEEEEDLEKAKA